MIENEFYEDDFELLLKQKADQFSMYPSKRVWHSIYNNLHPGRRWPSVVISLVLISSLLLIGYLNTGENSITRQINNNAFNQDLTKKNSTVNAKHNDNKKIALTSYTKTTPNIPVITYNNAFADVITNETDFYTYIVVKSNRPIYLHTSLTTVPPVKDVNITTDLKMPVDNIAVANNNNSQDIIQSVDAYIKSNKIFSDITISNKKYKNTVSTTNKNTPEDAFDRADLSDTDLTTVNTATDNTLNSSLTNTIINNKKNTDKKEITNEEKAWIENYALQNKPSSKKWKGRLAYQIYATPAVNYRKLTTKTNKSSTPFAEGDINNSISQKPGVGIEAGVGLNYAVAKKLQIKAGVQFNYTSYNINASETNHPVLTNILLNDPTSGVSYSSARTTTISNAYDGSALVPVTLHNRTYQISVPIGFAYKLSSQQNVDWFAGASVQPSYFFGGNAHIVSSDLKNYVSEPSSIRAWNLNLGFETYMNFKLGTYNLQVGPQVRYQVNSTYKKTVALIEKPYAVGLKFGLTKGF
jgi:Outer membrane protein beta-barrel domain